MSEHVHRIRLSFLPGVAPKTVELTHRHATKVEEPHKHTLRVAIHTEPADTLERVS